MYKKPELSAVARALATALAERSIPVAAALVAAQAALESSEPTMSHYPEPRKRHEDAKKAVAAVLADKGAVAPTYTQTMDLLARAEGARTLHNQQAVKDAPVWVNQLAHEQTADYLFETLGRYARNPESLIEAIRAVVAASDGDISLFYPKTFELFATDNAPRVRVDAHNETTQELAQFNDLRDTWDVKALTALLSLYDATFLRNRALILRTLLAQKNGGVKDIQGSAEVLYEGPVVDWSVNEGAWDRAEPPSEYQISVVKENENQFCIRLAPKHERPDDLDGKHQLAVTIEVDKDVPHVMLSNDIYGDQVLLAHTTRNGLYIEPATANNPERADSEEAAALEYNKRGWFLVNEVD